MTVLKRLEVLAQRLRSSSVETAEVLPQEAQAAGGGEDALGQAIRKARSKAATWAGPGRHSSKFKGVSWSDSSGKWRAQCWDGTKVRHCRL